MALLKGKYTDIEIIKSILSGQDDRVLGHLYKEVLPMIKSYILKNQGTEDEAKDIFQDAVIRFYQSVKTGKFQEKCSISTFLFGISRNLWINTTKRKSRMVGEEPSEFVQDSVNLMEQIITEEKVTAVNQLLGKLGENCERLLRYSVYEDLSMREIAKKMGYSSEEVAKTYNYRCKQKLLQLVQVRPDLMQLFGK